MPTLPVEFDAIELFDAVDVSAKASPGTTARGMLRLWVDVFRTENDVVNEIRIRGFFPNTTEDFPAILAAFNFLEPAGHGLYRVKGCERLLGRRVGWRKGGNSSKSNLRQFSRHVGRTEAGGEQEVAEAAESDASRRPAGEEPVNQDAENRLITGLHAGSTSALQQSAISNQQLTTTNLHGQKAAHAEFKLTPTLGEKKKNKRQPEGPHHAFIAEFTQTYERIMNHPYAFQPKDGPAVSRLLQATSIAPGECERRAKIALSAEWFRSRSDLATFVSHWNKFAVAPKMKRVDISESNHDYEPGTDLTDEL